MSPEFRKGFVCGYAVALANAVRLEDWRPDQNSGGFSLQDFIDADVPQTDINVLKKAGME